MDSRKIVLHETLTVLIGEAVGTAAMFGIFALLKSLDLSVLLGGLIGILLAVGNFFFMAMSASLAADKAAEQDVAGGKKMMQSSYMIRLVVLFGVLFLCAKSGFFNLFALVIPLVFVRPTITVAEFFRKKGEHKA